MQAKTNKDVDNNKNNFLEEAIGNILLAGLTQTLCDEHHLLYEFKKECLAAPVCSKEKKLVD